MASLYFKFGTMGSGKSLQLLAIANNYEEQGKKVLLFKAAQDDRINEHVIFSRIGISKPAIPVHEDTNIFKIVNDYIGGRRSLDAVLVDEVQFLNSKHIRELADIVDIINVPVMTFGLKNDYRNELFEGSRELLLQADNIEEIKTMCFNCRRKATTVALFKDGERKRKGEQIIVDNEENKKRYKYVPVCRSCYNSPFI